MLFAMNDDLLVNLDTVVTARRDGKCIKLVLDTTSLRLDGMDCPMAERIEFESEDLAQQVLKDMLRCSVDMEHSVVSDAWGKWAVKESNSL